MEISENTRKAISKTLSTEMKTYNLKPGPVVSEPEIYLYWVMHATKFLKEGGRLGMIISNSWLQTDYGINFGRFLLDHYKIKALIDISYRLFEALTSTVIILAEKCSDKNERENNEVVFIHVPVKVEAKKLGEVLSKIGDYLEGKLSLLPSNIIVNKVKQKDIPRDQKWIRLFFSRAEEIVRAIEQHPLMIRAGEWFWVCEGNSIWSIWAMQNGKRPGLSPQEFFFFNNSKIREWGIPQEYLVSAITDARWIESFTFTDMDWKRLRSMNKNVFIFLCHKPRDQLPKQVLEYLKWGEPICPYCGSKLINIQVDEEGFFTCKKGHKIPKELKCITRLRHERGGERRGGIIASESYTSKARKKQGYPPFYDWYDLGGYIPTLIMAIYQAFYHPQFFLCTIPVITYHAIIVFIPKIKIETGSMRIDPEEYKQHIPGIKQNIILDEREIKAILAYMISTFNWIWIEQNGRRTGGGIIALEPKKVAEKMPIINVKAIDRNDVEELAELFDELEKQARKILQMLSRSKKVRKSSGEEVNGPELELVKQLRPIFKKIDEKTLRFLVSILMLICFGSMLGK